MHLILLMQGTQLMAENQRLRQVIGLSLSFFVILFSIFFPFYFSHKKMSLPQMENMLSTQTHVLEQGQSSESISNICNSSDPPQDNDNSDTSLKLG